MTGPEHRSRTAWPGPLSTAGVGEGHTHDLPDALRARYRMLLGAVVGLLLAVGCLTYFVYQQQQYIEGRGAARDRENERLEQQITDAVCDLLDQLPEGVLLDRPREKYHCGPGIPLEDLPPEIRQRYAPTPAPTTPPLGSAAQPNPPRPTPYYPPPDADPDRPAQAPSASPTPTPAAPTTSEAPRPLDPVSDRVCDLLNICLEEIP